MNGLHLSLSCTLAIYLAALLYCMFNSVASACTCVPPHALFLLFNFLI